MKEKINRSWNQIAVSLWGFDVSVVLQEASFACLHGAETRMPRIPLFRGIQALHKLVLLPLEKKPDMTQVCFLSYQTCGWRWSINWAPRGCSRISGAIDGEEGGGCARRRRPVIKRILMADKKGGARKIPFQNAFLICQNLSGPRSPASHANTTRG